MATARFMDDKRDGTYGQFNIRDLLKVKANAIRPPLRCADPRSVFIQEMLKKLGRTLTKNHVFHAIHFTMWGTKKPFELWRDSHKIPQNEFCLPSKEKKINNFRISNDV